MIQVNYYPGNRTPSVFGGVQFNGVNLNSGSNLVSSEDLIKLRKHTDFKSFETQGVCVVYESKDDVDLDDESVPDDIVLKPTESILPSPIFQQESIVYDENEDFD